MTERVEERQIHGTWILEEMSTEFPGKAPQKHEGAEGTLMYDADLKTVFARISRPDENQASGKLLFEYAGHYSFGEKENEIVHNIEWATNPKMVGKPMKREFNLVAPQVGFGTAELGERKITVLNASPARLNIVGPSAEYPDAKIVIRWQKLEQ